MKTQQILVEEKTNVLIGPQSACVDQAKKFISEI